MQKILVIASLFALLIVLSACPKPKSYPIEPNIKFRNVQLKDSIDLLGNDLKNYKLVFNITDGDGDIGLKEGDTTGIYHFDSLYYNNIFLKLFEVVDGEAVIINDTLRYRTQYIQPQGQNPTLIADIQIDYPFEYQSNGKLKYDTVFFEFYMYDREHHKSNIEETPKLFIDTTGFFGEIGLE